MRATVPHAMLVIGVRWSLEDLPCVVNRLDPRAGREWSAHFTEGGDT